MTEEEVVHAPWGILGYMVHNTPSGFLGWCGSDQGSFTFDADSVNCLNCLSLMLRPRIEAKFFLADGVTFKSDALRDEFWGFA